MLALTGGQRTVTDGYLNQAKEMGYTEGGAIRCDADGRCEGERSRPTRGLVPERATFGVEAVRNDRGLAGTTTALVLVSVSGSDVSVALLNAAQTTADKLDIPSTNLPEAGQSLGEVQFELRGRRLGEKVSFEIEEGSQPVVPALLDPREDLLGESMIAILRFDENAGETLANYARQAANHYPGSPYHETWNLDDNVKVTHYASHCPAGCGQFELTGVRWIDGVTYGLLRAGTRF